MIIDEIKKANMEAMKNHDTNARNIYGILMNKHLMLSVEKKTKNETVSDNDMIAILQKTDKELAEEMENYVKAGKDDEVANIKQQIDIVKKFLPQMMSAEEIKQIILGIEDKSIPNVMKHFKANYAGKCDMRLVQEVLKSI